MNNEDKLFLDMIDNLNENELRDLIADIDTDKNYEPSEESINKIKSLTYNKLNENKSINKNIVQVEKKNMKRKKLFSLKRTAVAAAILGALFIPFSNDVIAGIKKMFQYIPGINQVVEKKTNENLYILKDEIKVNTKHGYVELLSLTIDNNNVYACARGVEKEINWNLTNPSSKIMTSVKFHNGQTIKLGKGSISCGSGSEYLRWRLGLSNDEEDLNYKEGEKLEFILEFPDNEKVIIPTKLNKAVNYDSYAELGPTTKNNELSITAVPKWNNGKLKINLLTPNNRDTTVERYGQIPNSTDKDSGRILDEKISLTDSEGSNYKITVPKISFRNISEFYFDAEQNEAISYKLNIPYVIMKHNVDIEYKLKLPKLDEKIKLDNKFIELKGYKLKLLSIKRTKNDEIEMELDLGYDESVAETLYDVRLTSDDDFFGKPDYDSWSADYKDDKTNEIGPLYKWTIWLNHPKDKYVKLNIHEFYTMKKGPWIIDIDNDRIYK